MEKFIMRKLRQLKPSSLNEVIDIIGFGKFSVKVYFCMGLLLCVDGIQINTIAILADLLRCEWDLSTYQQASTVITVFCGMAAGGWYWGWLADSYGRKIVCITCIVMTLYFGALTTVTKDFTMFMVLRAFVGFGVGGVIVAPCYLAEMIPTNSRGKTIMAAQIFFAGGSIYAAFIAFIFVNQFGWRLFVALSVAPIPCLIPLLTWLPESVHYLRNTDKYDILVKILHYISLQNKTSVPNIDNIKSLNSLDRGSISILFKKKYIYRLAIMFVLYVTAYSSYYAVLTLHINSLLETSSYQLVIGNSTKKCKQLTNYGYFKYFLASFGDIAGCFFMISFVDLIGRRKSATFLYLASCACFVGLIFFYNTEQLLTVLTLVSRACITAGLQLNTIYTAELFPTILRGTALGLCMMGSRISMILLPFLIIVFELLPVSLMILFCGLCIFCIVLLVPLPETKGRDLINS